MHRNAQPQPPGYLTSLSAAPRRLDNGAGAALDRSDARSFRNIFSHSAFSSTSPTWLSFIRSWRIAIDTKCAVSRLPLSISAALHCSSSTRMEGNGSSEIATSVITCPARVGRAPTALPIRPVRHHHVFASEGCLERVTGHALE